MHELQLQMQVMMFPKTKWVLCAWARGLFEVQKWLPGGSWKSHLNDVARGVTRWLCLRRCLGELEIARTETEKCEVMYRTREESKKRRGK